MTVLSIVLGTFGAQVWSIYHIEMLMGCGMWPHFNGSRRSRRFRSACPQRPALRGPGFRGCDPFLDQPGSLLDPNGMWLFLHIRVVFVFVSI